VSKKKLIFIELNEINFDLVKIYAQKYDLKNFKYLIKKLRITSSEDEYELLEPWIQWYSIRTGMKAKDHKVFRLGDSTNSDIPQIFEKIENLGFSVGAISPMNSRNNCKNPKYFIPDPWTNTRSDNSILSTLIDKLLKQTVNDNAKNSISLNSYLIIIRSLLFYTSIKNFPFYLKYFFTSYKAKWRKALFLDLLIHDIHMKLLKEKEPNYSSIFFNAGAHIQHHYLFNSMISIKNLKNPENVINLNSDPCKETIFLYEKIIGDYLKLKDYNIIIATGLTQEINERAEFYYRLNEHEKFLKKLNIKFKKVYPRMSRDFLIEFQTEEEVNEAYLILSSIKIKENDFFGVLEKRDKSLFVTLTYSEEITMSDFILINEMKIQIKKEISFVSIKNGKHSSKGFCFFEGNFKNLENLDNSFNIVNLHNLVLNYFKD
jgi:hypothetical protein